MASSHGKSELRNADWMSSLPESMHSIPLTNLAIPGKCAFTCTYERKVDVGFENALMLILFYSPFKKLFE